MRRHLKTWLLGALLSALFSWPQLALAAGSLIYDRGNPTPAFVGLGDVLAAQGLADATQYYSLRAYTAAMAAAGTQKIIDITNTVNTCTVPIGTAGNGYVDLTVQKPCATGCPVSVGNPCTARQFANCGDTGPTCSAVCTGSTTSGSSTLTIDSCSYGTIQATEDVSAGAAWGFEAVYFTGTGTGGAGTYTIGPGAGTGANATYSHVPIYFASIQVSQIYHQIGSGPDINAGANSLFMYSGCPVTKGACILSMDNTKLWNSGAAASSNPRIFVSVYDQLWSTGFSEILIAFGQAGTGEGIFSDINGVANVFGLAAGAFTFNIAANDGVLHSVLGLSNGSSSVLNADCTEATGNPGSNAPTTNVNTFNNNAQQFLGFEVENAIGPSATTATLAQRNAIIHNERLAWGTGGTC